MATWSLWAISHRNLREQVSDYYATVRTQKVERLGFGLPGFITEGFFSQSHSNACTSVVMRATVNLQSEPVMAKKLPNLKSSAF